MRPLVSCGKRPSYKEKHEKVINFGVTNTEKERHCVATSRIDELFTKGATTLSFS